MTEEIHNRALMNALIEIKKAYTVINWSFLITKDGTIITSQENAASGNLAKSASALQSLVEKAGVIGGLETLLINGQNGKVYVSSVNDMYLVAGLARNADLGYFQNITGTVFSTILRILEDITPKPSISDSSSALSRPEFSPTQTPTQLAATRSTIEETPIDEEYEEVDARAEQLAHELGEPEELDANQQSESHPSQQLIVDRLGGLMVKSDTVQLDSEVLRQWSTFLDQTEISEVEVETFDGKTVRFKAKAISDSKLENKGLIRIPEKTCQELEIKRGELVRVKPVKSEKAEKTKEYEEPEYFNADIFHLEASTFRM